MQLDLLLPFERKVEIARWPKHAAAWKRAVRELWEARSRADPDFGFKTPEALWEWWTNDQPPEPDECQGVLDLWA